MGQIILTALISIIVSVGTCYLMQTPKRRSRNKLIETLPEYKPLPEFKDRPPPKTPKNADENALKAERLRSKENGRDKDSL